VKIKNKIYHNTQEISEHLKKLIFALLLFGASHFCTPVHAQDLEPGFLSATPIGSNIAIASTGYSQGNILLDNTIPIEDLKATIYNFALGYFHSFKLFNRLTKIDVVVPYGIADFNGILENEPRSVTRNGLGDPMFRLSMILVGVNPLKPQEFFKQEQQKFRLGASVRVKAPLGQYDADRLINIGANRWALKTGLGASYTIRKKLVFEANFNTWLFGVNDHFFGGNTSKQNPLYEGQFHTTYIFKPGIWIAASIGGIKGGAFEINGVEQSSLNNARYGLAFAYKLSGHHSLKAAYTNGFITSTGDDFNTFLLAYQYLWFDKK
jgi:hypothetical protein